MRTGMSGTQLLGHWYRTAGSQGEWIPYGQPEWHQTDDSFSSLDLHKFMMDGKWRKKLTMAQVYCQDPRTGKPIEMGHETTSDASYEPTQGPFVHCHDDIMSWPRNVAEREVVGKTKR